MEIKTREELLDYNDNTDLTKKFVAVDDLKQLETIMNDFDCTCRNEMICPMCAFKKLWFNQFNKGDK